MTMQTNFRKQSGAALIVGLLLLVVITVLAISGMSTATTELAMARNDQNYENAFQAAETGLEAALAQGQFNSLGAVTVTQYINSYDKVTADIQPDGDPTIVPDRAFSLASAAVSWPIIFSPRQRPYRNVRRAPPPTATRTRYTHRLFMSSGPRGRRCKR